MKYYIAVCAYILVVSLAWATPTPPDAPVTLNFPQNDVGDILSLYASLTHFKIIRDSVRYGPLALSVAGPVTPQEAIDIIEKTLFINGFSIIQVDATTVEIDGPAKNPRGNGVPTVSEPAKIPTQERVLSYLFTFKHRNAQEMQQVLGQYLSPPKTYTSLLAVPDTNALWLTERSSVIRRLVEIMEKLDSPDAKQVPPNS